MEFKPHQPTNAIARVSFVCEFAQLLDDGMLRQFYQRHGELAIDLPKASLTEQPVFTIVPGSVQPVALKQVASLSWEAYARDGTMERALQLYPGFAVFVHQKYTRWDEVWSSARGMLMAVLTAFPTTSVAAFGLEYVDQFTAPTGNQPPDVSGTLNRTSQYLVPRVFEIPGPWHSHHGSLRSDDSTPVPHGKNANINLDLIRDHTTVDQYILRIVLRHRRILVQPVQAAGSGFLLDEFMREMHEADKKVLRDLVTDAAAIRIGLEETCA